MITKERFVEIAFEKIVRKFPDAMVEYQFNSYSQTHFFKVCPASIYNSDEYFNVEGEIESLFCQLDTSTDLAFVTVDALISLDNPSRVAYPLLQYRRC